MRLAKITYKVGKTHHDSATPARETLKAYTAIILPTISLPPRPSPGWVFGLSLLAVRSYRLTFEGPFTEFVSYTLLVELESYAGCMH